MRKWVAYILPVLIIITGMQGCKKFYSFEGGVFAFAARGSLLDTAGNCRNILVSGNYFIDTQLNNNNHIAVQANITAIGKYTIYTDTVNGYWFRDTGTVTHTGIQTFTLQGYGKPVMPVFGSFHVYFSNTVCQFSLLPDSAVYTFNAPVGSCPNIAVNGKYMVAAALDTSNTVIVPISVTVPGFYSIQTATTNGMLFSAKGFFPKTGNYSLALTGSGTPIVADTTVMPVTIARTNCSFPINVVIDTSMHWQFTVEGITHAGYMWDSARTHIYPALDPGNKEYGMQMFGAEFNIRFNNKFMIYLSRLNTPVSSGVYNTLLLIKDVDYCGSFHYFNGLGTNSNTYYSNTELSGFTIKVSVNTINKIVEGTFSGPVLNAKGQPVNLTDGKFKIYLAY